MKGKASFRAIVGCGGRGNIEPSMHVLNVDGENLMLDVGYMPRGYYNNVLYERALVDRALKKLRKVEPLPVGILVSHAHLDHIGLLAHAFYSLKNVSDERII